MSEGRQKLQPEVRIPKMEKKNCIKTKPRITSSPGSLFSVLLPGVTLSILPGEKRSSLSRKDLIVPVYRQKFALFYSLQKSIL